MYQFFEKSINKDVMKYNILKWHEASIDPNPGKLLLIQHWEYVYPDFRFALFSIKGDNEYYQVFPDEPTHGPIKLKKNDIIFWAYLPEVK